MSAWIETSPRRLVPIPAPCRTLMSAWIETSMVVASAAPS